MASLMFVVPVWRRRELATICLRQLRRTCDALERHGTRAGAILIGNEAWADQLAHELGFGWAKRNNGYLSRKFNDGIQLACDPRFNDRPADYVAPCGSDDWVDWRLFHNLPDYQTVVGFKEICIVDENAEGLYAVDLKYEGGSGIRIWPRELMAEMDYRPADEMLTRGCDTSILINTQRRTLMKVDHRDSDPRQIVDWKSHDVQVNSFESVRTRWCGQSLGDPFEQLADMYPPEALTDMERHHARMVAA